MKKLLALCLAWFSACSPAFAFGITVGGHTVGTATPITVTSVTASVGSYIVVGLAERVSGGTLSVSDNGSGGSNTYTLGAVCSSEGQFATAPVTHALSAGTITVTYTGGSVTGLGMQVYVITGQAASSPVDAAAAACNAAGSTTTPTVTSGTPSNPNELFIGNWTVNNGNSLSFTSGGSWSAGAGTGNGVIGIVDNTLTASGSGTQTDNPTTNSSPWTSYTFNIMALAPAVSATQCNRSLLGVGC